MLTGQVLSYSHTAPIISTDSFRYYPIGNHRFYTDFIQINPRVFRSLRHTPIATPMTPCQGPYHTPTSSETHSDQFRPRLIAVPDPTDPAFPSSSDYRRELRHAPSYSELFRYLFRLVTTFSDFSFFLNMFKILSDLPITFR